MFKIISTLFLIVLGVVANGEIQNIEPYNYVSNYNSSFRTDEYINMNRQQYVKNIEDYDVQMEQFKQSYAASLETIDIRQDMLVDTLVQTDAELNPLEILSTLSQKCVSKYRTPIPTVAASKSKMNTCVTTASQQLGNMLTNPLSTRNAMQSYLKNTFENSLVGCQRTYNSLPLNYTICAMNAVEATNKYVINNQKTFATQMDVAECSSKANIKKALDCSYLVEKDALSEISKAKTLIHNCVEGQDDCKQCNQVYTCSQVHYMRRYDVSYTSRTMENPFYGRSDIKDCLMIQIQ